MSIRELIHGGDLVTCRQKHPQVDFIDFSANINPLGMPQGVADALQTCAEDCVHYPDALCRALKTELAAFEKVPEETILCGNGAADIIYRMAYSLRPKTALLLAPTFAEYECALGHVGCAISYHMLREEDGFAVDERLLPHLAGQEMVILCNPNNPTGSLIDPVLLREILRICEKNGAVLVVDECFLDFLPDENAHTLKPYLQPADNLILLRAFTKIFAMPGLRLGYGLFSNRQTLAACDLAGAPWSVSVPAQLCGIAAMQEGEYLAQTRTLIAQERIYLQEELTRCGYKVYPPAVNYILFRTDDTALAERLCEKGFAIRDCSNYRGLAPGYFRIAVRTHEENAKLIAALKEAAPCQPFC